MNEMEQFRISRLVVHIPLHIHLVIIPHTQRIKQHIKLLPRNAAIEIQQPVHQFPLIHHVEEEIVRQTLQSLIRTPSQHLTVKVSMQHLHQFPAVVKTRLYPRIILRAESLPALCRTDIIYSLYQTLLHRPHLPRRMRCHQSPVPRQCRLRLLRHITPRSLYQSVHVPRHHCIAQRTRLLQP